MKRGLKESKSQKKKKKFWGIFRGLLRKERDKLPASPNGYIQLEDPDEKKKRSLLPPIVRRGGSVSMADIFITSSSSSFLFS